MNYKSNSEFYIDFKIFQKLYRKTRPSYTPFIQGV
jgi:hypothetical protein